MTMATCATCSTKITSLRDAWVHLAADIGPQHQPIPDPGAKKAETAARARRRKGR